ncbi:Hypothetical predicted protein [Pelobates cultripes]|uniref:Uncharacterized protein n=1 Tax=Pelobates cultripes TaxID=61616 RepID=A0AAD1SU90_PELCU|nr:Hypothetical predicted protein [Pelobates cultripes]
MSPPQRHRLTLAKKRRNEQRFLSPNQRNGSTQDDRREARLPGIPYSHLPSSPSSMELTPFTLPFIILPPKLNSRYRTIILRLLSLTTVQKLLKKDGSDEIHHKILLHIPSSPEKQEDRRLREQ